MNKVDNTLGPMDLAFLGQSMLGVAKDSFFLCFLVSPLFAFLMCVTKSCPGMVLCGSSRIVGLQGVKTTDNMGEQRTNFTKSRSPLERVLFLGTPLRLTLGRHSDPPSY